MTMDELARAATDGQMIPNAPIQATRPIQIADSTDKVWSTLVRVCDWERWHPYLKNAGLQGPFAAGTPLTYGGLIKHKLRIAKVQQEKLVMLYGTMAGYRGVTRWDVEKIDRNKTQVSFTESSSGLLIGALYSNEKLGEHLQYWLNALKAEVEH